MPTTFRSNGQSIPYEDFAPTSGTPSRNVVVAYGTEALEQPFGKIIRDFCTVLAANGFRVLLPDLFAATSTQPGMVSVLESNGFNRWVEVLSDAVSFSQAPSNATIGQTALVGFSLGGHLVLRTASDTNAKAVIDFFGPLNLGNSSVNSSVVAKLPPVQIHHGEADKIVNIDDSIKLDRWLSANSNSKEFFRYPANGHPGQERFSPPGWSAQAQDDATKRSLTFLARFL